MVQVITPTRLMPGGLNFITSNRAIAGYHAEGDFQNRQNQDDRAQEDQEYQRRAREIDAAEDESYYPSSADAPMPPGRTGEVTVGEPTLAPSPAPEPPRGLAALSSAPAPAALQTPYAPTTPAPAEAAPPLSAGTGKTGLSAISTRPEAGARERAIAESMRARGPKSGLNRKAYDMEKRADAAADAKFTNGLAALDRYAKGDVAGGDAIVRQYGVDFPPQVRQDADYAQSLSTMGAATRALGQSGNQKFMGTFMEVFNQTRDPAAAMKAALPFAQSARAKVGTFKMSPTGDVLDTTQGTVKRGVGTPGAGNKEPARIQWVKYLAKVLGSEQKALEFEARAKTNPNSRPAAVGALARTIVQASSGMTSASDAMKEAEAAFDALGHDDFGNDTTPQVGSSNAPSATVTPPAEGDRIDATNDSGEEIYSVDGGEHWYNAEDDTPYDEGE